MTAHSEKHKFFTRWCHWVNFPVLSAMIFSGMLIYWAYDPYRIGAGDITLFHFFPERFYEVTGVGHQLARGMALHFAIAWLFALNGFAYIIYTLVSGEWRELLPQRKSFREAIQVAMHDMGFKVPMPPQGLYNAAQRISYSAIIVMGGFSLITGLAIYKPAQLHWLTAMLGGYEWARFEHFWLTMGYAGFFLIHIAQVIRAGWSNFRSMVSGYEIADSHTRRSFLALGAGAVVAAGGWKWLNHGYAQGEDVPGPLRSMLRFNEHVVRGTLFSDRHLVKTYPASAIGTLKQNDIGDLPDDFDAAAWSLQVIPHGLTLHLDDIRTLPRHEEIIDFKCVEGWSVVTQFAGARFSDFVAKFAPGSERSRYVSMTTPDGGYYVGLDMPSALHPQTLLAYEMNGHPLTDEHGAPLRLVIPVKYGIKNIKRIGQIAFSETEPKDYWRERGYDFYAGL